jgi:hypothetical protein
MADRLLLETGDLLLLETGDGLLLESSTLPVSAFLLETGFKLLLETGDTLLLESGIPSTVPDAPTGLSAVKGNASAIVSFTPPAFNGNSTITGYTVTSSPGGIQQSGFTSPIVVPGLTNGVPVVFTAHATNIKGDSVESAPSNSVTPSTVPGAPTSVTASPGNGSATISFVAPSNGGAAIDLYRVTASPGGSTFTGTASPIVFTGLGNNTDYTFTVAAHNANGYGSESAASNTVTPSQLVAMLVRAPYLSTDLIGTKQFRIYTVVAGVQSAVGGLVTTGFNTIPNVANGWMVRVQAAPNGSYGDFYGIAVFENINGSAKRAVELYSPPTSTPLALNVCKRAPFLATDPISTPGYQVYDANGAAVGSHVTTNIAPISGVTNGYAANITLSPDATKGFQGCIVWDG